MSTLLYTVTLEDWQNVVSSTLSAAKHSYAQARAWLAQYLIGKPACKAPTHLTVEVQQFNVNNPLVNHLSKTVIDQHKYPSLHKDDAWEDHIKVLIAAELAEKLPETKIISKLESARLTAYNDGTQTS